MNKFIGLGRLTKDIELRYTQDGKAVAQGTLAITRKMDKDSADFLNFVVWGKQAEVMAQYLAKGSQVAIEGRIQTRNYDKDGHKVYVTEIVVEAFDFVGGKDQKQNGLANEVKKQFGDSIEVEFSEDELPF